MAQASGQHHLPGKSTTRAKVKLTLQTNQTRKSTSTAQASSQHHLPEKSIIRAKVELTIQTNQARVKVLTNRFKRGVKRGRDQRKYGQAMASNTDKAPEADSQQHEQSQHS